MPPRTLLLLGQELVEAQHTQEPERQRGQEPGTAAPGTQMHRPAPSRAALRASALGTDCESGPFSHPAGAIPQVTALLQIHQSKYVFP